MERRKVENWERVKEKEITEDRVREQSKEKQKEKRLKK